MSICVICYCVSFMVLLFFFVFKQKTAYEIRISDWSSDVCSSDLNRLKSTELRTFERDGPWTTTQTTTYLAPCFGDFDNSVSIWSHAPPRPPAFSPSPAPRDTFGRIAQLPLKGFPNIPISEPFKSNDWLDLPNGDNYANHHGQ